jgi:hypothetical protein
MRRSSTSKTSLNGSLTGCSPTEFSGSGFDRHASDHTRANASCCVSNAGQVTSNRSSLLITTWGYITQLNGNLTGNLHTLLQFKSLKPGYVTDDDATAKLRCEQVKNFIYLHFKPSV